MSGQFPDKIHLRHCMLFEFHRNPIATVATNNICDIYGNVLDVRTCQRWFDRIRNNDFNLEDRPRSGPPVLLDNDVLKSAVEEDPRQTIEELADRLGVGWSTIQEHLKQIGKVWRVGVWVPHELTIEQKANRVSICNSLRIRQQKESFLDRIVTGDEKWVLYDNPHRPHQYLNPGQKPLPTAKPGLHPRKVLLCVWWDSTGVIHLEVLEMGQTVTADIYCHQLDRLNQALKVQRPALVNRKGVLLQQDNARPHTAKVTQDKIRDLGWDLLPHPAYSPDIAPSDYHLFRSLRGFLQGKKFANIEVIETALNQFFASKPRSFYDQGIKNLVQKWQDVIYNDGEYLID